MNVISQAVTEVNSEVDERQSVDSEIISRH